MSEWKLDERGYRFREIGNGCIEYAGTLETTRGIIDEDAPKRAAVWHDLNSVQEIQRSKQAGQTHGKICPLKAYKGILYRFCDSDCAFYDVGGCALSNKPRTAQQDTAGMQCPIIGTCTDTCAFYEHGCSLSR